MRNGIITAQELAETGSKLVELYRDGSTEHAWGDDMLAAARRIAELEAMLRRATQPVIAAEPGPAAKPVVCEKPLDVSEVFGGDTTLLRGTSREVEQEILDAIKAACIKQSTTLVVACLSRTELQNHATLWLTVGDSIGMEARRAICDDVKRWIPPTWSVAVRCAEKEAG
jgi:hypothetical protein